MKLVVKQRQWYTLDSFLSDNSTFNLESVKWGTGGNY